MYKLIKVKENINSFRTCAGHFLEVKKGDLFDDGSFVAKGVDSYNYTFHDEKIIYLKGEETFVGERIIKKTILIDTVLNGFALFSSEFNIKDFTLKYEFVNLDNGEVVLDLGSQAMLSSAYVKSDDIVILNFGKEMFCFTALDKVEKKWSWSGSSNIEKIIGVHRNKVIVACANHKIVTVDRELGKIIHEYQEVLGLSIGQEYQNVIPESTDFVLDDNEGKLIGLFHTYIIEILLEQKEVVFSNLSEELKTYNLNSLKRFSNNAVTKDYIFSIAHTEDSENKQIEYDSLIALNRESKKIDWQHHFRNESMGTNVPQVKGDILYQKDVNHQLYIFNKSDQPA